MERRLANTQYFTLYKPIGADPLCDYYRFVAVIIMRV